MEVVRDERLGKVFVPEEPRDAAGHCRYGHLARNKLVIVVCTKF